MKSDESLKNRKKNAEAKMKNNNLRRMTINIAIFTMIGLLTANLLAQFGGGDGSAGNPYQIERAEHLNAIRNHVGADNHFVQTADIDLGVAPWNEGQGWEPISDFNNKFGGTYNGAGYKIKGFTINRSLAHQSLFGQGDGATVKNIRLIDVDVMGGQYTGTLFSHMINSTISDCYVKGSVKGASLVGGIAGYVNGGTISGCCTTGEVAVIGTSATGGFGGIAGHFLGNAAMTNCYSTAVVQGYRQCVGGLVGYKTGDNSTISNSYSTGMVIAVNEFDYVGGLVGQNMSGTVSNSFWNTETTGRDTSPGGGRGINTSGMVRREIYQNANWEFPDVWNIVEGETYPFLAWEDGPSLHNRPYPLGLTVDGDYEEREIALEWNMVGNPNRYNVYRNNVFLRSVNHPTRELIDTNVELFVEYTYYVEAVFVEGEEELVTAPSNSVVIMLYPPFAGGDGSINTPYWVANEVHLYMIRFFMTDHFIQTANIDLSEEVWIPVGSNNARFQGTYNGNGFRITGMNLDNDDAYQGLFGYAENAEFWNITLEDVEVRMGQYSGALVGRAENTIIENVTVTGNIQAVGTYVGGLVGYATVTASTISNCSVSGTMTASANNIGGLMGSGSVTINNCWTDLEITTAGAYAGGLVGSATSTLRINRCAVLGNITSTSTTNSLYLGGLVGSVRATYIEDCYVIGDVTSSAEGGRDYVGGLIGSKMVVCYTILKSYTTGNVTGRNYVGGLVGAIQNANATSIEDCYAMGTITGVNHVGGLIGGNTNTNQSVLRCYSVGRVFGNTNVGGLIGSGNGTTTNSYWNTQTSEQETSPGGGLARNTNQMTFPYDDDIYVDWDFEAVWRHDADPSWNDRYPRLHYQERPTYFPEIPLIKADIIKIDGIDHFRIRWELVDGARSYRIYASNDPMVADWGNPVQTVGGDVTTYTEPVGENRTKYFYVTASAR